MPDPSYLVWMQYCPPRSHLVPICRSGSDWLGHGRPECGWTATSQHAHSPIREWSQHVVAVTCWPLSIGYCLTPRVLRPDRASGRTAPSVRRVCRLSYDMYLCRCSEVLSSNWFSLWQSINYTLEAQYARTAVVSSAQAGNPAIEPRAIIERKSRMLNSRSARVCGLQYRRRMPDTVC